MSIRYSANLSMLWADRPPLARFDAAAAAGFTHVEMLFPQTLALAELRNTLDVHGLHMALFDFFAGNWEDGERGLASLPGRVDEFRSHWETDLELAQQLGTRTMTVLAGVRPASADPESYDRVLVENLGDLGRLAASHDITITLEAINSHDVPGYHVRTLDHAAAIAVEVGLQNVKIQLDQYHVGREGDDPLRLLEHHFDLLGHVQIADVPGRHEPGTGTAPIREFLERLEALDYQGRVGLEYLPSGDSDRSLDWLPRDARG